MDTAAQETDYTQQWGLNLPHVRKAIAFVRKRGRVTAEELVTWDRDHGRRLFNWDDPDAAEEWRRQQARMFLNRFRAKFEGMRVRAFIHVRENEEQGVKEDAYYTVESIAQHSGMREQIIGDVTRRMSSLAGELKMWRLGEAEQRALFDRLRVAMSGDEQRLKRSA